MILLSPLLSSASFHKGGSPMSSSHFHFNICFWRTPPETRQYRAMSVHQNCFLLTGLSAQLNSLVGWFYSLTGVGCDTHTFCVLVSSRLLASPPALGGRGDHEEESNLPLRCCDPEVTQRTCHTQHVAWLGSSGQMIRGPMLALMSHVTHVGFCQKQILTQGVKCK